MYLQLNGACIPHLPLYLKPWQHKSASRDLRWRFVGSLRRDQTDFIHPDFIRLLIKMWDMIPTWFKFSYKSDFDPRFRYNVSVLTLTRIKYRYTIKQILPLFCSFISIEKFGNDVEDWFSGSHHLMQWYDLMLIRWNLCCVVLNIKIFLSQSTYINWSIM